MVLQMIHVSSRERLHCLVKSSTGFFQNHSLYHVHAFTAPRASTRLACKPKLRSSSSSKLKFGKEHKYYGVSGKRNRISLAAFVGMGRFGCCGPRPCGRRSAVGFQCSCRIAAGRVRRHSPVCGRCRSACEPTRLGSSSSCRSRKRGRTRSGGCS